jgi:hypothetical protein
MDLTVFFACAISRHARKKPAVIARIKVGGLC